MSGDMELIPSHFGDIMSSRETTLILPEKFLPLERIILTANGNLQRIISAYYNATVAVDIIKNTYLEDKEEFDREVQLTCLGKVFCKATSSVKITNSTILRLVIDNKVGIGQLFRYLHILPEFELLEADKTDKILWRVYRLSAEGVTCTIKEVFPANLFALFDPASATTTTAGSGT